MSARPARHQLRLAALLFCVALAPWARAEETAPQPLPSEAELQPEPASDTPAEAAAGAREFGNRGLVAYSAGDFGAALEHFGRAEELAHSPVFQLYIARSLAALGRTEEARAVYHSILEAIPEGKTSLPGSTDPATGTVRPLPAPWLRARGEAERELAELLHPSDAPNTGATTAPTTTEPPRTEEAQVEQKPTQRESLPPPAPASKGLGPQRWAAITAFSIGGAGLVTAVVTGSVALSLASEVRDNCVDSVCPAEDQPKADRATTLGNVATAAIVVAAVGTITGVTLLALAPPRRQQAALALEARGPSLVLRGRF